MSKKSLLLLLTIQFTFSLTKCDIYLHNPRGSNNRLNENTRERRNGNRLFDSQNNERGGYNVGQLYYLAGSKLQIEWTNQHSCGDENAKCEIILQYMCHKNLRDGFTAKGQGTIPSRNNLCEKGNCSTDFNYGMHEDYRYYDNCRRRIRNKGLFLADQKLKGNSARFTRQNPNGNRYGYECPEERDYYPYWHPTPWKDIAVLTDNPNRCKYYQRESANVKERWDCRNPRTLSIPSSAQECRAAGGNWTKTPPHGLPAPVCREPQWSRDNHLGNTRSGQSPSYNWTVPRSEGTDSWCTLRIRYNISTGDYDPWSTNASGISSEVFARQFGFRSGLDAKNRGYQFKNNPIVKVFSDSNEKLNLELAINTAQYGRVFQDRSHSFLIKPTSLTGTIHNINVRGKRGNIVQVYPSVEYDYTPNRARITVGDHVHFQWTGSNTNNPNNDGQGIAGSDRNNVLLQAGPAFKEAPAKTSLPVFGHWSRSYPTVHGNNFSFLSLSKTDIESLAYLGALGDNDYLNAASTYFDLQPRKVTRPGMYHYMCSRNNDFSNRSQKGLIIVGTNALFYPSVGKLGGKVESADRSISVNVAEGTFDGLEVFKFEILKKDVGERRVRDANSALPSGHGFASDFVLFGFSQRPKKVLAITMKADTSKPVIIYRGNATTMSSWEHLKAASSTSDSVTFHTNSGGVFFARYNNNTNVGLMAALIVLGLLFVAGGIVGTVVYFKRNPAAFRHVRNTFASKI